MGEEVIGATVGEEVLGMIVGPDVIFRVGAAVGRGVRRLVGRGVGSEEGANITVGAWVLGRGVGTAGMSVGAGTGVADGAGELAMEGVVV